MTDYESKLLGFLLGSDFPGRDELQEQVANSFVRDYDENGSFEFEVASSLQATSVKYVVPTEGESEDLDGVKIHVLLHVNNNKISEVEIFREDNSKVIMLPDPTSFRVFAPG